MTVEDSCVRTKTTGPEPLARRDERLDAVRGIALWLIYSGHIPGNAILMAMPVTYGLSDMAEVFVFTSGCVGGISCAKRLSGAGLGAVVYRAIRRSMQIYCAWIGTVFAYAVVVAVLRESLPQTWIPGEALYTTMLSNPGEWMTDAIVLRTHAGGLTILSLYLCLVLLLPAATYFAVRRPEVVLAVSLAVYTGAQCYPDELRMPSSWGEAWFFNPFAWQLIFVSGVVLGACPMTRRYLPRNWGALVVAIAVWEVGLVLKVGGHSITLSGKANLEPARVVHFASVVVIGRAALASCRPMLSSIWLAPLLACGRNPLSVYCVGVILSCVAAALLDAAGYGAFAHVSVNVIGYGILTAVALACDWRFRGRWKEQCNRTGDGSRD